MLSSICKLSGFSFTGLPKNMAVSVFVGGFTFEMLSAF